MAGVAGPMFDDSRREGTRFLLGLTAGAVTAAVLVGTATYLLGTAAGLVLEERSALVALAAACLVLSVMDLLGRTPHVWRQVPQALVRRLPPGFLGTVWGFDIGLLFTTQKVTSMLWAALVAVALLQPPSAPALLAGVAVLTCLTIALMTAAYPAGVEHHGTKRDRRWLMSIRSLSGLILLGMAGATAAQAALI